VSKNLTGACDTIADLKGEKPVIEIVWVMQAAPDRLADFEKVYSPSGRWVQLFRQAEGYISTGLLPDLETEDRFLVIDRWRDLTSFESFKKRHQTEYDELDRQCEALTIKETRIGIFKS
jgi:quinol monooxygenase YgiN